MIRIGSHVGMNGKEMMLGSAKEAASYGANVFMAYTGAPQNTRRKEISELNIDKAWEYMDEHGIDEVVIHAPYIINLANTVKPETYELAVEFLAKEIERAQAMRAKSMVLHPGSHVGAGVDVGINKIIEGLNEVLTSDTKINIALETMAGKGSEIGRNFEELARIYDGVKYNDKLRVCFDTCHVNDSGYDLVNDLSATLEKFDKTIGTDQIAVFHINDSKNETLHEIVHLPEFESVPKILETPYIKDENDSKKSYPPYKEEIAMLRKWFHIFIINKIDNMMIGKSKATMHLTITAIYHKCLNDY